MNSPKPRQYTNGQVVDFIGTDGRRTGTVVDAMLVGVRHPGWVYQVDCAGSMVHVASGLIVVS